jgi:hypothetical protein
VKGVAIPVSNRLEDYVAVVAQVRVMMMMMMMMMVMRITTEITMLCMLLLVRCYEDDRGSSTVTMIPLPMQLPDFDSPYLFGLPDNIERSIQRTRSAAVIAQLRALSTSLTEAKKFDRWGG